MNKIEFDESLIPAIGNGSKTETRRPVKFDKGAFIPPEFVKPSCLMMDKSKWLFSWIERDPSPYDPPNIPPQHLREVFVEPKYKIGDILYVREQFRITDFSFQARGDSASLFSMVKYKDGTTKEVAQYGFISTPDLEDFFKNDLFRPKYEMPAWAARHYIEVIDIKLVPLHSLTEEDAIAEGFGIDTTETFRAALKERGKPFFVLSFIKFWENIYGEGNWDKNYWVWVYKFKKIEV